MSPKSYTSGDPKGNVHFLSLDGLRGIAVTLVFLFHASIYWPSPLWNTTNPLGYVSARGAIGVDIFFVLSGFLITGILLKARSARNFYSAFYARRAFRIFPLYYAAVAVFFILSASRHIFYPAKMQIWYWLNLSSWYSAFRPNPTSLTHFWTLANEEQFYFFWPILVRNFKNRTLVLICVTVIPLEYGLRMLPHVQIMSRFHPELLHRLPLFHSEGLFLGSLLAILLAGKHLKKHHLPWLRASVFVSMALAWASTTTVFANELQVTMLQYTLLAIASATVIALLVTSPDGIVSRLLKIRCLRLLGRYSFCIYIIHIPILFALRHRITGHLTAQNNAFVAFLTLLFVYSFTVLTAALSWRYFEEPILSLKRRFMYVNS